MFGKRQKGKNEFGDECYQMKNEYNADMLVVANLQRVSSAVTEFGPMIETTGQKYIFEIVEDEKRQKYREVFTGFIASDEQKYFDLPYVVNVEPYTNYFPETIGVSVPKLSLIWTLNDVNYPKEKQNILSKK